MGGRRGVGGGQGWGGWDPAIALSDSSVCGSEPAAAADAMITHKLVVRTVFAVSFSRFP